MREEKEEWEGRLVEGSRGGGGEEGVGVHILTFLPFYLQTALSPNNAPAPTSEFHLGSMRQMGQDFLSWRCRLGERALPLPSLWQPPLP